MSREHDAHFTGMYVAQCAKRERWTTGGNINNQAQGMQVESKGAHNAPIAGSTPAPASSLPRPYERDILAACLQALELHPRVAWCYRMNTGGMQNAAGQYVKFGFKGMADILGMLKDSGKFLAVECKRPGESLTLDQQAFLHRVIACGGVAFVARSVDDVVRALK